MSHSSSTNRTSACRFSLTAPSSPVCTSCSEEFEHERAFLVVAHKAAAVLEFGYEGIGQLAEAGAGGGEVAL